MTGEAWRTCAFEGCGRKSRRPGSTYCDAHYRQSRKGDLRPVRPVRRGWDALYAAAEAYARAATADEIEHATKVLRDTAIYVVGVRAC